MYQYNDYFPNQFYQPRLVSRFVSNIDEAKSALIDPLSVNIFIDSASGKIYIKKMNNNGIAEFFEYAIVENAKEDTFTQIENRLLNIENILGGLVNDKSISDVRQSISESAVASENESNEATKSAGFSENARNDKWQKRN